MTDLRPLLRPHLGWIVLAAAILLWAMGLLAIGTTPGGDPLAARQGVYGLVAIGALAVTALVHHRLVAAVAYPAAALMILSLVVLILPGMPETLVPVRNGARRWIDLQIVNVQPSALAKVVFVLAVARYLRFRDNYRTLRGLTVPVLMSFVPVGLIVLEPDLGTALLFLPTLFAMLLTAGARLKHLLTLLTVGLALLPALYPLLQPYQQARIHALISRFEGSTRHRDDSGYQSYKAMTVVGAGRIVGQGSRAATLIRHNALPEARNDMIYAVVCARWGLLGGGALILGYLLLFSTGLLIAALNKDPFARLMAVGAVSLVFTQTAVNIGMTLGLLPITGLTLPLVSYGGSSLVANFAMLGLVVNAAVRRPVVLAQPAFEFDLPARQPA